MSAVEGEQAGMAGGVLSTMRYMGGVAGTGVLGAMLTDPANAAAHQRPVIVYGGALAAAAVLSVMLPSRVRSLVANVGA
jgi:hypothetical protein